MDSNLKFVIVMSILTAINASLFILFIKILRHREPILSKHRHPQELRRNRNEVVDIDEIIQTAEIMRIGQL